MNPKFFRNGIVMLVLVVGTAALLFTWIQSSSQPNQVGYSQFLNDVRQGVVQEVTQQGDTLTVKRNGAAAYTVTVPSVLTIVYPNDMQAAAKEGNVTLAPDIYKAEPAPDTSWLGLLLTGLLPLLVIGGFIFFMMRQAQGTNNQALSFGKSRARMFLGNKTVVTFNDVAGVDEAEDGAPGSRRVPEVPGEVQLARRAHPARRPARRASGHRQDPDGPRGRG